MRTTAEETRRNDERIIDAAIKVFSEKGFEATSMKDIADEAQISRGPLYYRYKTKKEIFMAAIEAYAKQEMQEHTRMLMQHKPFHEKLRDYLFHATRNLREGKSDFPMEISGTAGMEDINAKIRSVYAWVYSVLTDTLVQAVRNGELRSDTDVENLANLIFIVFDGLRYSRQKTGILTSPETVEIAIDQICTLVQFRYGNP